jgi:diguanylate cyclase (GGDEF)-like protein
LEKTADQIFSHPSSEHAKLISENVPPDQQKEVLQMVVAKGQKDPLEAATQTALASIYHGEKETSKLRSGYEEYYATGGLKKDLKKYGVSIDDFKDADGNFVSRKSELANENVGWKKISSIPEIKNSVKDDIDFNLSRLQKSIDQKKISEFSSEQEKIYSEGAKAFDPIILKIPKIERRINQLKESGGNEYANAFERGDISFVIQKAMGGYNYAGDKDSFLKMQKLMRDYENTVKIEDKTKKNGAFKNLILQTIEMLPPMVQTAAISSIPVVGPAIGLSQWAIQGAGDASDQMVQSGVSFETAREIAPLTGIIYAAIEKIQLKQLTNLGGKITQKAIGDSIAKVVGKLAVEKGKDFLKEINEEGMQRLVTDIGVEIGKQTDGVSSKDVGELLPQLLKNYVQEVGGAAGPMGILGLIGLGGGISKHIANKPDVPHNITIGKPTTPEQAPPSAVGQSAEQPQAATPQPGPATPDLLTARRDEVANASKNIATATPEERLAINDKYAGLFTDYMDANPEKTHDDFLAWMDEGSTVQNQIEKPTSGSNAQEQKEPTKILSPEEISQLPPDQLAAEYAKLHAAHQEEKKIASVDPLTGMFNRRGLETKANEIGKSVDKSDVIILDVDKFKSVNDTYGHGVGDEVLESLGNFLNDNSNGEYIAGRWGGEEFAIVPTTDKPIGEVLNRIDSLRDEFKKEEFADGKLTGVTFSAGHGIGISNADEQLYKAKESGRSQTWSGGKRNGTETVQNELQRTGAGDAGVRLPSEGEATVAPEIQKEAKTDDAAIVKSTGNRPIRSSGRSAFKTDNLNDEELSDLNFEAYKYDLNLAFRDAFNLGDVTGKKYQQAIKDLGESRMSPEQRKYFKGLTEYFSTDEGKRVWTEENRMSEELIPGDYDSFRQLVIDAVTNRDEIAEMYKNASHNAKKAIEEGIAQGEEVAKQEYVPDQAEIDKWAQWLVDKTGGEIREKPSKIAAKKVLKAIALGEYGDILHLTNKNSRKLFTEITGVKLPGTLKGTKALFTGKPFEKKKTDESLTKIPESAKKQQHSLEVHLLITDAIGKEYDRSHATAYRTMLKVWTDAHNPTDVELIDWAKKKFSRLTNLDLEQTYSNKKEDKAAENKPTAEQQKQEDSLSKVFTKKAPDVKKFTLGEYSIGDKVQYLGRLGTVYGFMRSTDETEDDVINVKFHDDIKDPFVTVRPEQLKKLTKSQEESLRKPQEISIGSKFDFNGRQYRLESVSVSEDGSVNINAIDLSLKGMVVSRVFMAKSVGEFEKSTNTKLDESLTKIPEPAKKELTPREKARAELKRMQEEEAQSSKDKSNLTKSRDALLPLPKMNYLSRLQLVADSPETLRPIDIDRLKDDLGKDWPEMSSWLLKQDISDRVRHGILEGKITLRKPFSKETEKESQKDFIDKHIIVAKPSHGKTEKEASPEQNESIKRAMEKFKKLGDRMQEEPAEYSLKEPGASYEKASQEDEDLAFDAVADMIEGGMTNFDSIAKMIAEMIPESAAKASFQKVVEMSYDAYYKVNGGIDPRNGVLLSNFVAKQEKKVEKPEVKKVGVSATIHPHMNVLDLRGITFGKYPGKQVTEALKSGLLKYGIPRRWNSVSSTWDFDVKDEPDVEKVLSKMAKDRLIDDYSVDNEHAINVDKIIEVPKEEEKKTIGFGDEFIRSNGNKYILTGIDVIGEKVFVKNKVGNNWFIQDWNVSIADFQKTYDVEINPDLVQEDIARTQAMLKEWTPKVGDLAKARENVGIPITLFKLDVLEVEEVIGSGRSAKLKFKGSTLFYDYENFVPTYAKVGGDKKENQPPINVPISRVDDKNVVPGTGALIETIKQQLRTGVKFGNPQLTKMADSSFGGTRGDGAYDPRDMYDALEVAINEYILESGIVDFSNPEDTVKRLNDLNDIIPRQVDRTEEQIEFQQFSTPPAEAFIAVWASGVSKGMTVIEPSAGTGNIATMAHIAGAKVVANEISPRRLGLLNMQGFETYSVDAEKLNNNLPQTIMADVVIMNPPFSATGGRTASHNTEVGASHVTHALLRVRDGGRLVAIVGRGMAHERPSFSAWWDKMEQKNDVRANIGIDGKAYAKYGTGFDNQILIIDKTGPTPGMNRNERMANVVRSEGLTPEGTIDLLKDIAEEDINERIGGKAGSSSKGKAGGNVRSNKKKLRSQSDNVVNPPDGSSLGERDTTGLSGDTGRVGSGSGRSKNTRGGIGDPNGAISGTSESGSPESTDRPIIDARMGDAVSDGLSPVGPGNGTSGVPGSGGVKDVEQEEDSQYSPYVVKKATIEGTIKHPGNIVQSTALAATEAPDVVYTPKIPKEVIEEGRLSDVQMEAIVYAGQRHNQRLLSGERAEYLLGDSTGVGKGRTAVGVIYDNFMHGRKRAVWISVNFDLKPSAERDVSDVGVPMEVISQADTKTWDKLPDKDGILFTSYGLMSGSEKDKNGISTQARLKQIQDWLGDDFDGVIVFDESHFMKNAVGAGIGGEASSKAGSERGNVGLMLKKAYKNARIFNMSATSATVARNMAYLSRLGMWGAGAPFTDFMDFLTAMTRGGLGAMEALTRDLKAIGSYISRSISYAGVKFETIQHNVTEGERNVYNDAADLWSKLLVAFENAAENSGEKKKKGSGHYTAFYSTQQRFFLQLMTSLQYDEVVNDAKKQLAAGRSVVISMFSTNEGLTKKSVAAAKASGIEDIDDMDFSSKDMIASMVKTSFPIYQYVTQKNIVTGKDETVMELDAQGEPVINRENFQEQQRLLEIISNLNLPPNPFDRIVNAFGADNIAEISGRKMRLEGVGKNQKYVRRINENGTSKDVNEYETKQFQSGKKRVAIISAAASTGISLHSDKKAENKQQRVFYAMQLSWSADTQMQVFGRVHRSNQEVPPIIKLVKTDIKGQERLVNAVSRRLASLGAMTSGNRESLGGGMFSIEDLTDEYGENALQSVITGLSRKSLAEMGLLNKKGEAKEDVTVDKFLNRILVLPIGRQNEVFEKFYEKYQENIANAKAKGNFDSGVQKIRAKNLRIDKPAELIYVDPISKAKTHLVYLAGEVPSNKLSFEVSHIQDFTDYWVGYYQNVKSKRIYSVITVKITTNGIEKEVYQLTNPKGIRHSLDNEEFNHGLMEVNRGDAEVLWEKELSEIPEYTTEKHTILTGIIYPIYDKIYPKKIDNDSAFASHEKQTVVQATTGDNETYLGISLKQKQIAGIKLRLGIGNSFSQLSAVELFNLVKYDHGIVELDNGWQIAPVNVHNQPRIELRNLWSPNLDELKRYGAFSEYISSWNKKWFIPFEDEAGINSIKEMILVHKAVKDLTATDAPSSSSNKAKDNVNKFIDDSLPQIGATIKMISPYQGLVNDDLITEEPKSKYETGDLFSGTGFEDKRTPVQKAIAAEIRKKNEKRIGGSPDVTGLPMFEGGAGIVGGTEQLSLFEPGASYGGDIQSTEFKKWFGDWESNSETASKVVDDLGMPLVVYHGTPDARDVKQNGVFKTAKEQYFDTLSPEGQTNTLKERAYFFTNHNNTARTYANDKMAFDYQNAEPSVFGVYLSLKNPMVIDAGGVEWGKRGGPKAQREQIEFAKENGYDGIIIRNTKDTYTDTKRAPLSDVYIAFNPKQIKSATNNSGEYSTDTANMFREPGASYGARESLYSNAMQAVNSIDMPKAPASQWLKMLDPSSGRGTKMDEMKFTGLSDYLSSKGDETVSKEDIKGFLNQNGVMFEPGSPYGDIVDYEEDRAEKMASEEGKFSELDKGLIEQAKQAADKYGIHFDGPQLGIADRVVALSFSDPVTTGTFYTRDPRDVGDRLNKMREKLPAKYPEKIKKYASVEEYRSAVPYFYSPLLRAAQDLKQEKGTGSQLVAMILNQPGVKKAEVDWIGLSQEFSGKESVTKDEIIKFISGNMIDSKIAVNDYDIPKIEWEEPNKLSGPIIYSNTNLSIKIRKIGQLEDSFAIYYNKEFIQNESDVNAAKKFAQEWYDKYEPRKTKYGPNKYDDLTLPGYQNYKEVTLSLPEDTFGMFAEYDEPHGLGKNVYAHIRMDDRTDSEGNKVLFLEEIQSKWSQELREGNVAATNRVPDRVFQSGDKWRAGISGIDFVTGDTREEAIEKFKKSYGPGVLPMPFANNWMDVVLKFALRYASENGYDKVSWITGRQTADRYDLQKQVKYIDWEKNDDETYNIDAPHIDENDGIYKEDLSIEEVSRLLGKDISKRIFNSEGTKVKDKAYRDWTRLDGESLSVGGDWAYNLYDKKISQFYEKYGKPWGLKVENINIGTGVSQQSIAINDAVKNDVVYNGQSLFEQREFLKDWGVQTELDFGTPMSKNDTEIVFGSKEEVEKANTEIENQFSKSPISPVLGKAGATTVRGDWKKHRRIDFRGRVINNATELANMFSVFRHPRIEHFHIIYTDDNGKILAHNAMSSGLTNSSVVGTRTGLSANNYIIKNRMERLGATKYFIVHNHPSGRMEASDPDKFITKYFINNIPGFSGHVVLDHDRFLFIGEEIDHRGLPTAQTISFDIPKEDFNEATRNRPQIRQAIDVANLTRDTFQGENHTSLLVLDNQNMVVAWYPIKGIEQLAPSRVYQRVRESGGTWAVIATDDRKIFMTGSRIIKSTRSSSEPEYDITHDIVYVYKDGSYDSARKIGVLGFGDARGSSTNNGESIKNIKNTPQLWEPRAKYNIKGGGFKSVDENVDKIMNESRGLQKNLNTIYAKTMAAITTAKNDMTRHYPLLDPVVFAREIDILRHFESVPEFSKASAYNVVKGIIAGMGPKKQIVFERNIILPDLLKDIESGLYTFPDGTPKKLPFGYQSIDDVKADNKEAMRLAALNPDISNALDLRNRFMRDLRESLVREKFLHEDVLKDDRYFHHQVIEAMETKEYLTTGTTSSDFRTKRKGWQNGRVGYDKPYNTKYTESEFEVVAQGIALLEAADSLKKMKMVADISGQLKQDATEMNNELTKKRLAKAAGIDEKSPDYDMFDPFMPYRKSIAIAVSQLEKMASKDEIDAPEYSLIIEKLSSGYFSKKSGVEMDVDSTAGSDEDWWEFLSYLMDKGLDGSQYAGMIFKAISQRKELIKSTTGAQFKKWQDILPEGYVEWQPKRGFGMYEATTIPDKIASQIDQNGSQVVEEQDLQTLLALRKRQSWALPSELAATLDKVVDFPIDNFIAKALQKIQNSWKIWRLLNPPSVIKYNINNMSGDLDIAMAYDPKIMAYAQKAAKDLWGYNLKGKAPTEEMLKLIKKGVISSGLSVSEITDLNKDMFLKILSGEKVGMIERYWQTTKNFTQWRENILRLAAYRFFVDHLKKYPDTTFGASNRLAIEKITDQDDKAAKLARELIGDYGNISKGGQWLRRYLIPFYSWLEINAPRYYRLMQNAPHEGDRDSKTRAARTAKLGLTSAAILGKNAAFSSAMLMVKAGALYAAVMLWNQLFPDDEKEELMQRRRQAHLLLPNIEELANGNLTSRRSDGTIASLRFQGALSDALSWIGLEDLPYDVSDLASGSKKFSDMIKEAAVAPFQRIGTSLTPMIKSPVELLTKKSFYPNVFNPSPIRDPWENVARTMAMDIPYRYLAGKPSKGFINSIPTAVVYITDPGEAAYQEIKSKVYKFLDDNKYEVNQNDPTNKANALYYYKKSIVYKDQKSAIRWLKEYLKAGGTIDGISTSIRNADPLAALPDKYRNHFIASLAPRELRQLGRANAWYNLTYKGRNN